MISTQHVDVVVPLVKMSAQYLVASKHIVVKDRATSGRRRPPLTSFCRMRMLLMLVLHAAVSLICYHAASAFSPPSIPRSRPYRACKRSESFPAALSVVRALPHFTQVISDVDDTLKSSGGVNVAGVALGGIDTQYDRGDFYPGVAEFMLELSLHNSAGAPPKVAILTARAEEFKLALELKKTSKLACAFREAGEGRGIQDWGLGPVLYGSVAEWLIQDRKGLRKFSNFERLIQQDPTGTIMEYIYVGDTGELDQEASETMLREYPEVVKAAFLHCVSDRPNPPLPPPKLINGRPVLFFRTYVGAATMAVQLGLMSEEGLLRVVAAAKRKLANVPRDSDKWLDVDRDTREAFRTIGTSDLLPT